MKSEKQPILEAEGVERLERTLRESIQSPDQSDGGEQIPMAGLGDDASSTSATKSIPVDFAPHDSLLGEEGTEAVLRELLDAVRCVFLSPLIASAPDEIRKRATADASARIPRMARLTRLVMEKHSVKSDFLPELGLAACAVGFFGPYVLIARSMQKERKERKEPFKPAEDDKENTKSE